MRLYRYITIFFALCFAVGLNAQKTESPEHVAKREAIVLALDTLLLEQAVFGVDLDKIQVLIDEKCKEMKNDPELMSKVAISFGRHGNDDIAFDRFRSLKKMYPKNIDVYIDFANLLHASAIRDGEVANDVEFVKLAKAQLDSAKIAVPSSMRPYSAWLEWRAPLIATKGVKDALINEVEMWSKTFPDSMVYAKAARIFMNAKENRKFPDRYDTQTLQNLTMDYFDKAGIDNFTPNELASISQSFFFNGHLEKGSDIALRGMELGKLTFEFRRLALWNSALGAQKARYSDHPEDEQETLRERALESANWLKEYSDSLGYLDFVYSGIAYQEKFDYYDAINAFNRALATPHGALDKQNASFFQWDSLAILRNLSRCYNDMGDEMEKYQRATKLKEIAKEIESVSGAIPLNEWNRSAIVYVDMRKDTVNYNVSERLHALMVADSIYTVLYDSCQYRIDNNQVEEKNLQSFISTQRYYDYRNFYVLTEIEKLDNSFMLKAKEQAEVLTNRLEQQIDNLNEYEKDECLMNGLRYLFAFYVNKMKDYKKAVPFAEKLIRYYPNASEKEASVWHQIVDMYGGRRHR